MSYTRHCSATPKERLLPMRLPHAFLAALALAAGTTSADPIQPAATPAATRQAIQAAIDAAANASPAGTVALGAGTFELDAQLMVTGGVRVVGPGWGRAALRQTAADRVATLRDGSSLEGVTVTGGRLSVGWQHGAGVLVEDGTVSWCCVSNNVHSGRNVYGGGVSVSKGTVDHCLVAYNQAGTYTSSGGGIGAYNHYNTILIDSCLVYGNRASITDGGPNGNGGGGIGFFMGNPAVTIRNTTVAGNSAGERGGGILVSGNKTTLVNCIVAGNTAGTDADLSGTPASGSSNNLIGGDPRFADAAGGDYRLAPRSLAIAAGAAREAGAVDLAGTAFGTPPALGCYEFTGTPIVNDPVFPLGTNVTFSPSVAVALACPNAGASIYYTLDGSDPTDASARYAGPIEISATTTIRARAYKAGMEPSDAVSAVYSLGAPTPPQLGEVAVDPRSTVAMFSGQILSIGNNLATACDVWFAFGTRQSRLGAPTRVVAGATDSFAFTVPGLNPETTYYYELTLSNDAQIEQSASARGSFATTASQALLPVAGDPAATRTRIQDEIDAAALQTPAGTVVLGEGVFEIDEQLMVTGGVRVVGLGWKRTTVRQAAATPSATTRCAVIDDGAKLEGLTLTGARVTGGNDTHGGAALVKDGTISWCCVVSNSIGTANSKYGAGVAFYHGRGQIDHTIIAHNAVSANSGTCGGGGVSVFEPFGEVLVDTCLIYGNTQANGQGGAGVYASFGNYHNRLTVRNTTIANNEASGEGGGVCVAQYGTKPDFALANSILADNVSGAEGADPNLSLPSSLVAVYAEQSFGNLFANGTPALGADSKSVAGSGERWFVKAPKGNYHLPSGSPAVGVGKWYEGIAEDLDRSRRLKKPAAGCYEAQFCTIMILR